MSQGTAGNAPRRLAELFEAWAVLPKGTSLVQHRAAVRPDSSVWDEVVVAFGLLSEIDRILDSIEASGRNVAHYRRWRGAWLAGLIAPNTQWNVNSSNGVQIFDRGAIDQLYALADVVDGESDRYQVSPDSKRDSIAALDEILDALKSDTSLVELEKRYLFALVASIRDSLNEASVFGSIELARRIHELVGYLNLLAGDLEDRGNPTLADRFRSAARRVRPFVVGGTIAVAGAIDIAANLKELGS